LFDCRSLCRLPWHEDTILLKFSPLIYSIFRLGVLSSQVLAEFFVNATRKLHPPLTIEEAHDRIQSYLLAWEILDITGPIVLEAVRGARTYQVAYWDAQIWATTRLNQIPVVFSENFGSGTVIEGVRIVNPFDADFRMEAWLPESRKHQTHITGWLPCFRSRSCS